MFCRRHWCIRLNVQWSRFFAKKGIPWSLENSASVILHRSAVTINEFFCFHVSVDSFLCQEESKNAKNRCEYFIGSSLIDAFVQVILKFSSKRLISFCKFPFCLQITVRREEGPTSPSKFLEADFHGNNYAALFSFAEFNNIIVLSSFFSQHSTSPYPEFAKSFHVWCCTFSYCDIFLQTTVFINKQNFYQRLLPCFTRIKSCFWCSWKLIRTPYSHRPRACTH